MEIVIGLVKGHVMTMSVPRKLHWEYAECDHTLTESVLMCRLIQVPTVTQVTAALAVRMVGRRYFVVSTEVRLCYWLQAANSSSRRQYSKESEPVPAGLN